MSWQQTEFILKGVYLGLLAFVGLRLTMPMTAGETTADWWRAVGCVALIIQATSTALPITDPQTIDRTLFVIADWGEYAVGGLLATLD